MREIRFSDLSNRELDKFIAEGIGLEGVEWKPTPFEKRPSLIYAGQTEFSCPVPHFSSESDTAFLLLEKIRESAQALSLDWHRDEEWTMTLTVGGSVFKASHEEYARTVALISCEFFAYKRREA